MIEECYRIVSIMVFWGQCFRCMTLSDTYDIYTEMTALNQTYGLTSPWITDLGDLGAIEVKRKAIQSNWPLAM